MATPDFLAEYYRLQCACEAAMNDHGILDDEAFSDLNNLSTAIVIYGTVTGAERASECLSRLLSWASDPGDADLADGAHDAWSAYILQVREDLGVPAGPTAGPPAEAAG